MRLLRPLGKGWCPAGAAERHPARNAGLSRQSGWCSPVMEGNKCPARHGLTLPKNVAELQDENVVFELECIDRMYLNLYVPQLASAPGVAAYFRGYKGHRFASTKEAVAMSERFRRQVLDFAERKATPIIRFEKGMRKDDVMHKRLRKFRGPAHGGLLSTHLCQNHPSGPLRYPQHLLPPTCQWFAPSINSNQKSMLILSKRRPEKLDSNTPTSSVQGL